MEILFHENLCSEERKFKEISFTLFKFVVVFLILKIILLGEIF